MAKAKELMRIEAGAYVTPTRRFTVVKQVDGDWKIKGLVGPATVKTLPQARYWIAVWA